MSAHAAARGLVPPAAPGTPASAGRARRHPREEEDRLDWLENRLRHPADSGAVDADLIVLLCGVLLTAAALVGALRK